jgi:hypothetical protein
MVKRLADVMNTGCVSTTLTKNIPDAEFHPFECPVMRGPCDGEDHFAELRDVRQVLLRKADLTDCDHEGCKKKFGIKLSARKPTSPRLEPLIELEGSGSDTKFFRNRFLRLRMEEPEVQSREMLDLHLQVLYTGRSWCIEPRCRTNQNFS